MGSSWTWELPATLELGDHSMSFGHVRFVFVAQHPEAGPSTRIMDAFMMGLSQNRIQEREREKRRRKR
jgi:hypothetical protein